MSDLKPLTLSCNVHAVSNDNSRFTTMQPSRKPRLLIFIVAFHAETTIEKVLRRIPASLSDLYDVEILVIDDGSSDQTFREGVRTGGDDSIPFKVVVLYNTVNQGYGGNQKIRSHYAMMFCFSFL